MDLIEVSVNNLAAVPSIVFGLLGLAVYINVLGIPRSAPLAGGLTLALMILPTIIIATRASLGAVPDSIRDAARALGASPLEVVLHHSFPLAIPGIMTGTILGLARAMGETAPLLMIGMVAFVADVPRRRSCSIRPRRCRCRFIYGRRARNPALPRKPPLAFWRCCLHLSLMNSLAIFIRKTSLRAPLVNCGLLRADFLSPASCTNRPAHASACTSQDPA